MENKQTFCSEHNTLLPEDVAACSNCGSMQPSAPEISPATKVNGLLPILLALGATFLYLVAGICLSPGYLRYSSHIWDSWLVPLFTLVMVLTQNKKFATCGLVLAFFSLTMRFILSTVYCFIDSFPTGMSHLIYHFKGYSSFIAFPYFFQNITIRSLLNFLTMPLIWLKDIFAAIGCLIVIKKSRR